MAGLVTIEDVLEQIVGDIEDEYDFDEVEDNIVQDMSGQASVNAVTEITDCPAKFGTVFSDQDFDTIGGLVLKRFGRVPKRGEQVTMDGFTFKVVRADSRRLHLLEVAPRKAVSA